MNYTPQQQLENQLVGYGCPASESVAAAHRLIEFAKLAQKIMNRQNREAANASCNTH